MRKRGLLVLIIFSISLAFAYTGSIPGNGHGGDEFFIVINGQSISLQSAIDSGQFDSDYVGSGSYSGNIDLGHNGEVIMVNVGGVDKELQDAINDRSLCKSSTGGSGSYSGSLSLGHIADEVLVSVNGTEKTLQEMINAGDAGYDIWSPSPVTKCHDETLTQTNCGGNRVVSGTTCCDRTWGPDPANTCNDQKVTQTSNCGNVRQVDGTKVCCDPNVWGPDPSNVCVGDDYYSAMGWQELYVVNCAPTDTCDGLKGNNQWYTCAGDASMTCTDYAGVWESGDYNCKYRSVICNAATFTQTSECGDTREAAGSKDCCVDMTWGPATNTGCKTQMMTQTSNCGNTREVEGSRECCLNSCNLGSTGGKDATMIHNCPSGYSCMKSMSASCYSCVHYSNIR